MPFFIEKILSNAKPTIDTDHSANRFAGVSIGRQTSGGGGHSADRSRAGKSVGASSAAGDADRASTTFARSFSTNAYYLPRSSSAPTRTVIQPTWPPAIRRQRSPSRDLANRPCDQRIRRAGRGDGGRTATSGSARPKSGELHIDIAISKEHTILVSSTITNDPFSFSI